MATPATSLRLACMASTVLHRAQPAWSSSSPLSLGLVGKRTCWGAAEPCRLRTVLNSHPLARRFSMSSSHAPQSEDAEVEAELALVKKKCTPCTSKELRPMSVETAKTLLEQIPGWDLLEVDGQFQLQRSWKAKNFVKGLDFIRSIANVAESEGHHPDLHLVNWNHVKADIWTHAVGGLTENDFILAAKINALDAGGFLRRTSVQAPSKPPPVDI